MPSVVESHGDHRACPGATSVLPAHWAPRSTCTSTTLVSKWGCNPPLLRDTGDTARSWQAAGTAQHCPLPYTWGLTGGTTGGQLPLLRALQAGRESAPWRAGMTHCPGRWAPSQEARSGPSSCPCCWDLLRTWVGEGGLQAGLWTPRGSWKPSGSVGRAALEAAAGRRVRGLLGCARAC